MYAATAEDIYQIYKTKGIWAVEEFLKKGGLSIPAALLPEIIKNSNINFMSIKETQNNYIEYYKIFLTNLNNIDKMYDFVCYENI